MRKDLCEYYYSLSIQKHDLLFTMVPSVIVCLNILGISSLPPKFSCTHLPPNQFPVKPSTTSSVIPFVIGWFPTSISALFVHVCCHVDVSVICNVLMCDKTIM